MAGSSSQPNILFVMAGQPAPHSTGAYEHPVVRNRMDRADAGARTRYPPVA